MLPIETGSLPAIPAKSVFREDKGNAPTLTLPLRERELS